jgi:hypothetical protein
LWYTAFPLIPFLYLAFLSSWIWAPLVTRITRKTGRPPPSNSGEDANSKESRGWLVAVGGYISMGAFFGYYAYLHDSAYPLVGTDIYWRYVLPAERLLSSSSMVIAAGRERHALVAFAIALICKFLGLGVEASLRFAYVVLVLAFGGAVFLLVLVCSKNKALAAFSALITAVSPPAMAFIFTGTVAEWIALVIWIVTFALLGIHVTRNLRHESLYVVGLVGCSLAVLLVHPWTWLAMIAGLVSYPVITILRRLKESYRNAFLVLVVIMSNAIALMLSLFVLSKTLRVVNAFSALRNAISSTYLGIRSWDILVFFSRTWSQFLQPVVLILSVLGILILSRRRDRLSVIAIAWIIAASVTTVVAAPMYYDPSGIEAGPVGSIYRAMVLTPFQIPTAVALLFLRSRLKMAWTDQPGASRIAIEVVTGILLLAITNGSFRALFPLLTDPHNYPNPSAP